MKATRACSIEGCDRPVGRYGARGWCSKHYQRWRKHGDPLQDNRRIFGDDHLRRFWSKVSFPNIGDGCFLWTAFLLSSGYAQFQIGHRKFLAHRWIYQQIIGPIPSGLQLDHLCHIRHCVNPAHLEPVTARENVMRSTGITAANAAKTHCKQGHEFTPENTYTQPGRRECRVCNRTKTARYRARKAGD